MPTGRYPVDPVIARLAEKVPLLKSVEPVANLRAALEQQPAATPIAYVCTVRAGRKQAGATGGRLIQGVDVGVQIVLMVRNYAKSATGAGAVAEMDALIKSVDDALLNWSPSSEYTPLVVGVGQDAPYGAGLLVAHETYQSTYRIQADRLS